MAAWCNGDTGRLTRVAVSAPPSSHSRSIHNLGMVGHIEDIAVAKDQQGKKLGLRIIQALDAVAEAGGCYKVSVAKNHSCPCPRAHPNRGLIDYPRLLRSKRRVLCQVRIQTRWS